MHKREKTPGPSLTPQSRPKKILSSLYSLQRPLSISPPFHIQIQPPVPVPVPVSQIPNSNHHQSIISSSSQSCLRFQKTREYQISDTIINQLMSVKNSIKREPKLCSSRSSSKGFFLGILLLLVALVGLQLLSSYSLPLLPLPRRLNRSSIRNGSSYFCSGGSGTRPEGSIGEFGDMMVKMLPLDLPFTLFVPTPSAFDKFLKLSATESLSPEKYNNTYAIVSRVLGFSAVPRHLPAGAVPVRTEVSVDAVSGFRLRVWRDLDGMVVVNGIRSECVNVRKGEVIVHVVDGVLMDAEFEQSFLPDYEDR